MWRPRDVTGCNSWPQTFRHAGVAGAADGPSVLYGGGKLPEFDFSLEMERNEEFFSFWERCVVTGRVFKVALKLTRMHSFNFWRKGGRKV